jgi:hypothetical protein
VKKFRSDVINYLCIVTDVAAERRATADSRDLGGARVVRRRHHLLLGHRRIHADVLRVDSFTSRISFFFPFFLKN